MAPAQKLRMWSNADMEKAILACREEGMSASAASRLHKVPRKSLTDRLQGRVKINCRMGPPTALSDEQEKTLCHYMEYMADQGFPLTVSHILTYAWCIDRSCGRNVFGENGPCYGWWLKFKHRHPEFAKLRSAQITERGKSGNSVVNSIRKYFQLLKNVMEAHDFHERPQDIYNCDETIINLNKSCQKVVVPRRIKHAYSRQGASTKHISLLCCVSAAGSVVPPYIIYKGSFPGGNYTAGGPDGALYGKQESGVMDSKLFLKWLEKVFIPYACPAPGKPVLLLLDGHSSHCSIEVIEVAKNNNIILMALAPHTSYLCQPLDVAVYRSFRVKLGKLVKTGQSVRGSLWVPRLHVARCLKKPLEESMTSTNIMSGFRKCGIVPFNPSVFNESQLLRNKIDLNIDDLDLSVPPVTQESSSEEEPAVGLPPAPQQDASPSPSTSSLDS